MRGCYQLKSLSFLDGLVDLESLDLSGCDQVEDLQLLGQISKLKDLFLDDLPQLSGLHVANVATLNLENLFAS
jgi:hypothetical protein